LGGPQGHWTLKFSDEFNGTSLDTSKWNTCYPYSCTNSGNHELECYVAENVSVSDGMARLKAERRSVSCQGDNGQITQPYASGMITTEGKFDFLYGYMEARFRVPKGLGLWPALWTLPADLSWPPEIDAMEILGHEPKMLYMTYHYGTVADHRSSGDSWLGPDFSAGWHVMGVYWSAKEIRWYIDGVERRTAFNTQTDIVHKPMYYLADFAVGGDWPGSPDAKTVFPSYFDIDYVRIWQP
jgi:beta-glucanase (GH16 family)